MGYLLHVKLFAETAINTGTLPTGNASSDVITHILSIVLTSLGALALLMITLSGLRYITSAGNEQKSAAARSALIYSVVGLVVAIMAQAIVLFIGNKLQK